MKSFINFSKKIKKNSLIFAAGLAITLIASFSYIQQPLISVFLNNKIYDIILRDIHSTKTSNLPVIVDIDEKSLQNLGQWPWPRYRVALLLAKIKEAGALSVGMDILFADQDRTSPKILKKELKRDLKVNIKFSNLPDALMDNDKILANVLHDGPYVLGYFFNFGTSPPPLSSPPSLHPVNLNLLKAPGVKNPTASLYKADDVTPPLTILDKSAKNSGFFNTMTDEDGIVRRLPLLISWNNKIYPSLALSTLTTALKGANVTLKTSSGGIESLRINKTTIPLDRNGRLLLHYKGINNTFPYISAADILNGTAPKESLKNKIVFIGTSAAGLKDLRPTPLSPTMPGVEIHATVIDNIIQNDFLARPDWAPGLEVCLILISGIIISLFITFSNAKWSLPVTLILGIIMWRIAIWFLKDQHIFISPLFPILSLIGIFSLLTLLKFFISEGEKRFFRNAFSRYVSKSVVEQITNSPESLSLEGEEKELSILFSDIRSFTSLSERISPTEVINLLHDYFTPMTKIIIKKDGTIDKFIGDAIMAFWNAPLSVNNHQHKALESGIEMLEQLGLLNKVFKNRFGFEINIGIGIHSGIVRVGNMGTDDLFDYTIIGDNVNLASRLEGLTKYYGVRIVISETMTEACPPNFELQELDLVSVKGREAPVRIFGLYSGRKAKYPKKELALYKKGLKTYRNRNFQEAGIIFSELNTVFFNRKLYQLYEKRCRVFQETPPPKEWDGVFRHQSK